MALTLSQQLAKFPERILREGYVFKESRHWGSWRKRWLVLFKDMAGLPVLLTFKVARADWSAADTVAAALAPSGPRAVAAVG